MRRGISSIYGALVILLLFSSAITTLYISTQLNASLIRSESERGVENIRRGMEALRAWYRRTASSLVINVSNTGAVDTSIEYILFVSGGKPAGVHRISYPLPSGSEVSFEVPIVDGFDKIFVVTGNGNFIPIVEEVPRDNKDIIIINNTIYSGSSSASYSYIPPYTLIIVQGGILHQVYLVNMSIIYRGTPLIRSLDGNIEYFIYSRLLFINDRFIDYTYADVIGLGRDYIIFRGSRQIEVYFSNGSLYMVPIENYLGFSGEYFWFYDTSIKLDNGTILNRLLVVGDPYKGYVYFSFFESIESTSIFYPRIYGGNLYIVLNDSELLYTVSLSKTGSIGSAPLYSPNYIGLVGQFFEEQAIKLWWMDRGYVDIGYSWNRYVFDKYLRGADYRGIPEGFVGPIGLHLWQNASVGPVEYVREGSIRYLVADSIPVDSYIWFEYNVVSRRGQVLPYVPYDEDYVVSIVLSSRYVSYHINISIDGLHDDRFGVNPTGWLVRYRIEEVFRWPWIRESFSFTKFLNYSGGYVDNLPTYTWFRELIGIRRPSDKSLEILFINMWGDYVVKNYTMFMIDVPLVNSQYSLEIGLWGHITYNFSEFLRYDSQVVSALYFKRILFGGPRSLIYYIGPANPQPFEDGYIHYTDYMHYNDVVTPGNSGFTRHFWPSINYSIVAVDPFDYPFFMDIYYMVLDGFTWVSRPGGLGFFDGYPGLYVLNSTGVYRLSWVESEAGDPGYLLRIYGDYLFIIVRSGGLRIVIYSCWEVGG